MTNLKSTFFTNCVAEIAKEKRVLDVGGGNRFQKSMACFKDWFVNSEYISCDIDPERKPDVVCDAHNLPFKDGEFDAVICIAVLEHVKNPRKVVSEIHRVLSSRGKALFYVPFVHPYHGIERCRDYWRFTEDGLHELFSGFRSVEIEKDGGMFTAFAVFTRMQFLNPLWSFFDSCLQGFKMGRTSTKGYFVWVKK